MSLAAVGGCSQIFSGGSGNQQPTEQTIENEATCSVTRTECSGWIENDSSVVDEVDCPAANIVTNNFTATICYTTFPETQANDARAACNTLCMGDVVNGLYPLGQVANNPNFPAVKCSITGVNFTTPTIGTCIPPQGQIALPPNGATEHTTCSLSGRNCPHTSTTSDGTEAFCDSMPSHTQDNSGCFDPTITWAEAHCRRGDEFTDILVNGVKTMSPDLWPYWDVADVTPNDSARCPVTPVAAISLGIEAGSIGSVAVNGASAPLTAIGGSMTAARSCDESGEFCSTTLGSLTLQLQDVTLAGLTLHNPEARLVAPVTQAIGDQGVNPILAIDGDVTGAGHVHFETSGTDPMTLTSTDTTTTIGGTIGALVALGTIPVGQMAATLSVSGSSTSPNATCANETGPQMLLGFETLQDWSSTQVPVSLTADHRTQGCFGLSVGGANYRTINSATFPTPLPGTTSTLALDVFIPPDQPNQFYLGAVQMYLTCASANFFNQYIGQAELTGLPVGQFSTVTIPIPPVVEGVLTSAQPACFFSMAVNMNQTPTNPVLDNLRFQ